MTDDLLVRCGRLDWFELPGIEAEWQELERRSESSVFLSWQWIGTWLETYRPNACLLRVYRGERLIGLSVVVRGYERRHGILTSQCLRVHQTGQPNEDQIWIEYNGLLAERGCQREVTVACLHYLSREDQTWEEFIVGAIDSREASYYANATGLTPHIRWEAPCYGVDLNRLSRSGEAYLATLSRNTRYQISRSERLYQQRGELRIERPGTLGEALATFDSIGPQHLARWGGGIDQSGYANPEFLRFHHAMINAYWPSGGIDLVSIWAGDDRIACFYNLLYNKVAYFYLGGLQIEADNRLKPGLLGHALCIEDYRNKGYRYYDFMGGAERYKTQMGRLHKQLVQVALQRNRVKFRLENAVRKVKNRWFDASKSQDAT